MGTTKTKIKFVSLVASAALVAMLGLASCGSGTSTSTESSAAATSEPVSVRPFSSQVKVTNTGFWLTLFTASTAARASATVIMVSITNRSTPAFSRAAACSV